MPHPTIILPDGYEGVPDEFDLVSQDGNAMVLIGYTRRMLRRAGNPPSVLTAFAEEAMSGDYDHVIQTCMTYGGEFA